MNKQKTTKHGGARKGAGRPKVEDPKITLIIYPAKSMIDKLGADQARAVALAAIEKAAKKIKDS